MAVGDITNGTAYVNTGITYNFLDVVALSATQAIAVYTTGAGNDGKVMVIDVAGTVVTFGTPVALTSGDIGGYRVSVTKLSATKALCAYSYNSSGSTYGRIIDVSGSTPTVRAEKLIKTFPHLNRINLGRCSNLTDASIWAVAKLKDLKSLTIVRHCFALFCFRISR